MNTVTRKVTKRKISTATNTSKTNTSKSDIAETTAPDISVLSETTENNESVENTNLISTLDVNVSDVEKSAEITSDSDSIIDTLNLESDTLSIESDTPIHTLTIPREVATVTICGAISYRITSDSNWIEPTAEQIKNLKDTFCIDVRLTKDDPDKEDSKGIII